MKRIVNISVFTLESLKPQVVESVKTNAIPLLINKKYVTDAEIYEVANDRSNGEVTMALTVTMDDNVTSDATALENVLAIVQPILLSISSNPEKLIIFPSLLRQL